MKSIRYQDRYRGDTTFAIGDLHFHRINDETTKQLKTTQINRVYNGYEIIRTGGPGETFIEASFIIPEKDIISTEGFPNDWIKLEELRKEHEDGLEIFQTTKGKDKVFVIAYHPSYTGYRVLQYSVNQELGWTASSLHNCALPETVIKTLSTELEKLLQS